MGICGAGEKEKSATSHQEAQPAPTQRGKDSPAQFFLDAIELGPEDLAKIEKFKNGEIKCLADSPNDQQVVDTLFKDDKNGDGVLTQKEIAIHYGNQAQNLLAEFDLDQNDRLSKDEFIKALEAKYAKDPERTAKWIHYLAQEQSYEKKIPKVEARAEDAAKVAAREQNAARELAAKEGKVTNTTLGSDEQDVAIRQNRKPSARKLQRAQAAPPQADPVSDWSAADPSKWSFIESNFNGSYRFSKNPNMQQVQGAISEGIEKVKTNPGQYQSIWYQSNMVDWPVDQQAYTIVLREKGTDMMFTNDPAAPFTHMRAKYEVLPTDVSIVEDSITDELMGYGYQGYALAPPVLPGRGQGYADVPSIKLMDQPDPSDVSQGQVGDCWLLSAISSLAEFAPVIPYILRNTPEIAEKPGAQSNTYTVTLYDLPTWTPVDIEVDERLCRRPDGSGLLGAAPSLTGELWVPYLEKAIAAHCGGWDKIDGGTCTHAWRLLTGVKEMYTLRAGEDGTYSAFGTYNPNEGEWEQLGNSPHDGFQGLWPMAWPEVGGGGRINTSISKDKMFEKMCAWEDAGFVMAAGTCAGSDTNDHDGIVDGHAYTILDVENDVDGQFDMIKVRNPWGTGEFKSGKWDDDGPGWTQYPAVKEQLKPAMRDDGMFWLEKDEFFSYFGTVYLCARDMTAFGQDQ